LATVLGYVQTRVVDDACRHVPVARDGLDADGLVAGAETRAAIAETVAALAAATSART
jgi:hypothetical protein